MMMMMIKETKKMETKYAIFYRVIYIFSKMMMLFVSSIPNNISWWSMGPILGTHIHKCVVWRRQRL